MNHHRGIGVEHFFIRSETPQTSHALQKFTDVTLTSADATGQAGVDGRQVHNATNALKESKKMGITHVLHMDDDELLSFPRGFDAFQKHVQGISTPNIHICNYEMLAPHADVVNPFLECRIVQKNNWTFRGYGWGKCIGVVGRTTHSVDPHTFYGCFADTPPDLAVLYHYESLPYTRWLEKTKRYSDGNVQSRLSFVNDSVKRFRSNPGEEALKKFWRERCVYRGVDEMNASFSLILTSYNTPERFKMYEDVIQYYKKRIPSQNLYVIDSCGVGFDCIPREQQLVYDQNSLDIKVTCMGPTCFELVALQHASTYFKFRTNTVFKLTCKYKISDADFAHLSSVAQDNPDLVLQANTNTHGQNCEIIGFRSSFFPNAVSYLQTNLVEQPLEMRLPLLSKFMGQCGQRCMHLPALTLTAQLYQRSAGDVLTWL
tara:strand:+ start:1083 stop:2372 length:1290 start_codon:yes stop_codon:yes gene_type:complete